MCASEINQIRVSFKGGTCPQNRSRTRVINHGDLWANNMMFDENQPPNCMLVDFQFAEYAPPVLDVLLLLYLSTTRELRRESEADFIRFYHDQLRAAMQKSNPLVRVPTLDTLLIEIEEQRVRAVVFAAIHSQTSFLSESFAADVLNDPAELSKFDSPARKTMIVGLMERDASYRRRIQETIRELIEFSLEFSQRL